MSLPGWNNSSSADLAHSIFEVSGLILFAILVVFEAIAHKRENTGKPAHAFKVLALLSFALAVFCEVCAYPYSRRITKLHEEIENSSSNRLATAESSLQDLKVKYNEATNDLTLSSNIIADANAKLAKFSSLTPDRSITPEMKERFIGFLRDAPKGKVLVEINGDGGSEGKAFGGKIIEMMKSAGYDVEGREGFGGSQVVKGLHLGVRDKENPPSHAAPIQLAFKAIGLNAGGYEDTASSATKDTVKILVGVNQ